ncbi:hypothetical protein ANANG_G00188690 [Anguilla anguilla]|uniref:Serine/arginine repetitive matrix protein C-terminal domain-containing protein n=1 Tax=Anguilla anguilla TaxID=7936 RepID=A0A9D3M221_ANGAN|nr:hypothetical protein ANANG_G00188690 [Anguilla anguilla]
MAGLQEGEKQLFEKFWRGTFKAVATPRPGSVIVASITARRNVTNAEAPACQPLKADQSQAEPAEVTPVTAERSRRIKARERKRGSRRRMRSLSFDDDPTPRPAPKGKKKKKKSERKRRRKRSPSRSLSPVRKKKKKKSSKKRKRNRSASKKRRHSSSSKRKEYRKHKKRSRSHAHRRRRRRRSESESSAWRCSSVDSRHLRRSVERAQSEGPDSRPGLRQNGHASQDRTGFEWRPVTKSACTTPPNFHSTPSNGSIAQSDSGGDIFTKKGFPHDILSGPNRGRQDYDSGNDTSSPPSTKTNLSRSKVNEDKKSPCVGLPSPEKLRFTDGDNASDSGNSVTSYSSLCKPLPSEKGSANHVNGIRQSMPATASNGVALGRLKFGAPTGRGPAPPRDRSRTYSRSSSRSRSRSRSRSGSSRSSRRSPGSSRSRSLSSRRSYSHSPSYAAKSRSRRSSASRSSQRSSSYSRYTPSRSREPERGHKKYGSCEKQTRRGKERHRRRSYSPMRKRRRDSPSHLEARRITSARKRPIPYYRPSPSSSSRSTSYSSWCSLFTRSRSRTRSRSLLSSYRSYSRSSWSTLSGRSRSRSRSRSYDSVGSYGRSRR